MDVLVKTFNILTAEEISSVKMLNLSDSQHATIPAQHREGASCKLRQFPGVVSLFPRKQKAERHRAFRTIELRTPQLDSDWGKYKP